jgi:hypothetical protein
MVEQICARCDAGNPLDSDYCARCGAPLRAGALQRVIPGELSAGSRSLLPSPSMRQVGQAVAVSLAALVAEAGLGWLRRRLMQSAEPPAPRASSTALVGPIGRPAARRQVTISAHRIIRIWQRGELTTAAEEHSFWQLEE